MQKGASLCPAAPRARLLPRRVFFRGLGEGREEGDGRILFLIHASISKFVVTNLFFFFFFTPCVYKIAVKNFLPLRCARNAFCFVKCLSSTPLPRNIIHNCCETIFLHLSIYPEYRIVVKNKSLSFTPVYKMFFCENLPPYVFSTPPNPPPTPPPPPPLSPPPNASVARLQPWRVFVLLEARSCGSC